MLKSKNYLLTRTVPAAELPVTVAELKGDLRIEHSIEDAKITSLIMAATAMVGAPNGITGKALINETWSISVTSADCDGRIYLPVTPVQSISTISYYDSDNAQQSLVVGDFYLFGDEDWAYIKPKTGYWPATYDRLDAITVTFVAGFGADSESVPENIRMGIRLMASHWYEHRLAVSERQMVEVPMAAEMLLNASRKGWVA